MKRRILALVMSFILVLSLSACGGKGKETENTSKDGAKTTEDTKSGESGKTETTAKKKVALVSNKVGTNPFLTQMVEGLKDAGKKHNLEVTNVECVDTAEYEENIRAFANEGYDLIIGGGWESGEALAKVSSEYPDKAFALIDSEVEAKNVKCISYRSQESSYLVGVIAALVVDGESHLYGGVHVDEGAGSWKGRYGYINGVKSVDPEAKFAFNYVGSYNDPAKAKELALQISAKGAKFINAAAAAGGSGVFEAAKEQKFYTSGQDVDETDKENSFIVTSAIKDTYNTIVKVIDLYMSGWNTDNEEWGVAEGALGAVHATHESKNPMSERLSKEDLEVVKKAAEDIKSGKIDLKTIPKEEDFAY